MKNFILFSLGFVILTAFSTDEVKPIVSASINQLNVLYAGVEVPISIKANNISEKQLTIIGIGCSITRKTPSEYTIKAFLASPKPRIIVKHREEILVKTEFKVKKIPTPTPFIDSNMGLKNYFTVKEFKTIRGLGMRLDDFDFEAECITRGFSLTRITKDGFRQGTMNTGSSFMTISKALINRAKSGDIYIFDNIESQCSEDRKSRPHQTGIIAYIK